MKKRIESPAKRISEGRLLKIVRLLWQPSQDFSREFFIICGILALQRVSSIAVRLALLLEKPTPNTVAIHIS